MHASRPMRPDDDCDFREPWAADHEPRSRSSERPPVFRFREAGVERFNDLYDDGYDDE